MGDGAFGLGELGNTRTTFLPTDLPAFPCLDPALIPRPVTAPLDLFVAPEPERDIYGVKLELGGWRYVLDAQSVLYGPGWYPFHKHVTRREKDPAYPLNDREVPTWRTVPAPVRISPDVANRAWRNEYVQLTPVDHRVKARLQLYAGREQGCLLVRTVTLQIDLRAMRVTLPDQIPAGPLRHRPPSRANGSSLSWRPRSRNTVRGPASRMRSSGPGTAATLPARIPDAVGANACRTGSPRRHGGAQLFAPPPVQGRQPRTGQFTNPPPREDPVMSAYEQPPLDFGAVCQRWRNRRHSSSTTTSGTSVLAAAGQSRLPRRMPVT